MGRTPQEDVKIEQRRQQVAELYLTGKSQTEIAAELNVSQATISADLKAIRQAWRESGIRDFEESVNEELHKLVALEREAWRGWERSQQPAEMSRIVQGENGKKAEKTVRQQVGDPRFLELIHRAIAGRRALLGLDAPTRITPTSPDGEEAYGAHLMRQLLQLAEESPEGPEVVDAEFIKRQLADEVLPELKLSDEQSVQTLREEYDDDHAE